MVKRRPPEGVREKRRASGRLAYEARWRDRLGDRHSRTFDTVDEAADHLAAQAETLRVGGSADPTGGRTLLTVWLREWWSDRARLSNPEVRASTSEMHHNYIAARIVPALGRYRLDQLTTGDINDWVSEMLAPTNGQKKMAPASALKALQILALALDAAVDEGLIPVSPATRVRRPKIPDTERRFLTFSEAQQSEIERALERLSTADPDFATRYEAELAREDDGQGVGLFVKNLENVQGDERDVIIMSVCYAPGPDGRMRMNFGPINTAGGEKRLNVIFSRARQHMVLVSSIDHTAITNTYNDGANTLKNFLRYAAAVSEGDDNAAANLLAGLRERRTVTSTGGQQLALADQLADALEERGLEVARDVGQSDFRCDLAVRVPGAGGFTDAVLIDYAARLDRGALDERRLVQPGALAAAGWHVHHVLASEWLDRPDLVVDRLVESARSG